MTTSTSTAKARLQKQIAELERAIAIPQIEAQMPPGVTIDPAGEDLDLYQQIKAKLAAEDAAAEAQRVQRELANKLAELKLELSRIESADRHAAMLIQLESKQRELDQILSEVEPLAAQLQEVFERAIVVDGECRQLFAATNQKPYAGWNGTIANFRRYLPKIVWGRAGDPTVIPRL